MDVVLRYRGRAITAADVAFMRELIAQAPTASRRQLSQHLCAAWGWVQPNGAPRDMVCRGLMLTLARADSSRYRRCGAGPAIRWPGARGHSR